ncbi:hypothetical protein N6L24_07505 [Cognatishimia sp. SS12]|nr:hypothetical protein [Cognatishimia sp. SS12]MDC0738120.1 hypothetical protein [Cognatishimia sp. SS12]
MRRVFPVIIVGVLIVSFAVAQAQQSRADQTQALSVASPVAVEEIQ